MTEIDDLFAQTERTAPRQTLVVRLPSHVLSNPGPHEIGGKAQVYDIRWDAIATGTIVGQKVSGELLCAFDEAEEATRQVFSGIDKNLIESVYHTDDRKVGFVALRPAGKTLNEWTGTRQHPAGAFPREAMRR